MGDLSKNFSVNEMIKSQTALRHGIDNWPDVDALLSMDYLANAVLQPIRDEFGPTHISSGFRCLELNRKLGSKDTSQHIKGEAADIEIWGFDNRKLAVWINENLVFDQLILEFYDGVNSSSGWVHVSFVMPLDENKMQCLTINKSGVFNGFI